MMPPDGAWVEVRRISADGLSWLAFYGVLSIRDGEAFIIADTTDGPVAVPLPVWGLPGDAAERLTVTEVPA